LDHFLLSDEASIARALLDGQRVEITMDEIVIGPVLEENHLPRAAANDQSSPQKVPDEPTQGHVSQEGLPTTSASLQDPSQTAQKPVAILENEAKEQNETTEDLSNADKDSLGIDEFDPDKPISLPSLASEAIEGPKPAPSKFIYPTPPEKLLSEELPKFTIPNSKAIYSDQLRKNPIIIVIVSHLGLSATTTEKALELPNSVTLGFSPYSASLKTWEKEATEKGFQYLLNIPMETADFRVEDPGPYALITKGDSEENTTRLNMLLRLMDGYKGVYTDHDEIVTQNADVIQPVLNLLKSANIPFLYGEGYANYSFLQLTNKMHYPVLTRDVLLDETLTIEAINNQFTEAEQLAKKNGYAVVLARPYPLTLQLLKQWIYHLEDEKIATVVPASYLLGRHIIPPTKEESNVKKDPASNQKAEPSESGASKIQMLPHDKDAAIEKDTALPSDSKPSTSHKEEIKNPQLDNTEDSPLPLAPPPNKEKILTEIPLQSIKSKEETEASTETEQNIQTKNNDELLIPESK
jgi:hypothetical protein